MLQNKTGQIGMIAPSSVVPQVEFGLGVEKLRAAGFNVRIHPHCRRKSLFFSGNDAERAAGFFEYASVADLPVLWCARGGYGSARILPLLEKLAKEKGKPARKLLIGFSDSTAILEFVRTQWGWATLHAPMPATRDFQNIQPRDWRSLVGLVSGGKAELPGGSLPGLSKKLKFLNAAAVGSVRGKMAGGNLAVLASLAGTPWALNAQGKILFIEDLGEPAYRIDRMAGQLLQAGSFGGARAIVLGTFHQCVDVVPQVWAAPPKGKKVKFGPVRPQISERKFLAAVFGQIGKSLGIPVVHGLNVGHGKGQTPLPLGAEYELSPQGLLTLLNWDWAGLGLESKPGLS